MATKLVQDSSLVSIANAIRTKGGTSAQLEFPAGFVSAIQNIPTGGGGSSATPKDVNFYDYDGTIVASYTAAEFSALSAMPANPSHDGLTAQGWNWSLANAKAYVAKYGRLNIGQMYVTTSGDTEIDIQLGIGRNKPYLGCCPNGTVEIDWGDGSAHDTLTGTDTSTLQSIQHIYPDTGERFTIRLHVVSGSIGFIKSPETLVGSAVLYNGISGSTNVHPAYQNSIQAIRLGNGITSVGNAAFQFCSSLRYITMHRSVTHIEDYAFVKCFSLKSITIPESVTTLGSSTFTDCTSLMSIAMSNSVTSIGNKTINGCKSLVSMVIPDSVTSIGTAIVGGCSSLKSMTIPESVTTLGSSTFTSCTSLMSIAIPNSVTSIEEQLFNGCSSLLSCSIPGSVATIGVKAFYNCSSLASIVIPDSVTSIGNTAFNGCRSLAKIIFEPTNPPSVLGTAAFTNLPSDVVVYVPAGTLETYKAATNYSKIASNMVEMSA